ncbi:SRPBCC domain-containing protein [Flavobacterium sp. Sd200]|uniref:SRPBCC domain-containing protein n=1 Tax=Flavobacterium sp. Sd200 TaxID=2692211 RepID=UPI001927C7AA|nr:SRPBCC domain-containing protein [Flavobacterium sp. Sd200]
MIESNIIGLTEDTGYQIGVRKTYPVSLHAAWNFMFSYDGIKLWLGYKGVPVWKKGQEYTTKTGTYLCIRVYNELSHARLAYKRKDWENTSTLQIRIIAAKTGTTISIHQEKLADAEQREEMKLHWEKVLLKIGTALKD